MEVPEKKMGNLLGYKKILGKKELPVVDGLSSNNKCIVRGGESGILDRALRRNNVIGIIIKDNELIRMSVEEVKETDKLLFLSVHDLTCVDTRTRLRNLYRMRGLLSFATHSKAKVSLISLAEDESCLLSSIQMIEMAKFLGANEEQAKKMINNLGEIQ